MTMNERQDDGSLAFLQIPRDENSRSFNCDETTQSKLVNTEFWVVDFIEEVPTKFSKQNFCRAAAKLNKSRRPVPVKAYKMAVASWLGWAQHSNSKHLLKSIINPQYYASIL